MKVLQLTYRVPFPPTDGGAIGIYNITKGLSENGCSIDLVAINTPKHSQPKDAMKHLVKNQYDIFVDTKISLIKVLCNIACKKIPYNVERFVSKNVEKQLQKLLTENQYDFILIEGAFVVHYIDFIKKVTSSPIIVRTHNIEYVIWHRLSLNEKNPFKKWYFAHLSTRLKTFEANYYQKADGIAAITPEDKQRLSELKVNKPIIDVIPAGVVLQNKKTLEKIEVETNSIFIISALDWEPNIEGLKWFLDNVWGKLIQINPAIHLHIAGKSTPEWLLTSKIKNATIHGFVEDANLFKQSYQIMLVPLLSGGGMRVKIIEGMAQEKCIISTKIGAEGIHYTDKHDIVIAENPQEWIETIQYYLKNHLERRNIEINALKLASSEYDNLSITKKYIDLYQKIISQ